MRKTRVYKRVIRIVRDCCAHRERVRYGDRLEDLSLDSLSFVDCVVRLEKAFSVTFDDDRLSLADWETAGDLAAEIERLLGTE